MKKKFKTAVAAVVLASSVTGYNIAKEDDIVALDLKKSSLESMDYSKEKIEDISENLVKYGTFSESPECFKHWRVVVDNIAICTYENSNDVFSLEPEDCGNSEDAIQLCQTIDNIEPGKKYTLNFKAKSTLPKSITVFISDRMDVLSFSKPATYSISDKWTDYTYDFVVSENTEPLSVLRFYLGRTMGKISFTDIKLNLSS
ncbi:carbohydrate binding domain-containing protein [Clostridium cellulovorans]|nr:carbohydrate binding domain-containing protein [Clostridium cellulovorans]